MNKNFFRQGCKTVYEILQESDLSSYYDLEKNPGISLENAEGKFDFLDNEAILQKPLEFNERNTKIVSFLIPSIHCSSCIWILENLQKLHPGVKNSQVDFSKKTLRFSWDSEKLSLKELAYLLSRIGYEPYFSLKDLDQKNLRSTEASFINWGSPDLLSAM